MGNVTGTLPLDGLFSPTGIGSVALPNRIVMSPMTRGFAKGGIPHELTAGYYARRAQGGVGLCITEGVAINSLSCATDRGIPDFYGEQALVEWGKVADAVHQARGRIFVQLWHQGLLRPIRLDSECDPSVGPSGKYPVGGEQQFGYVLGRTMTDADISQHIDDYATAAAAAKSRGFDGVEIHAAHGYLIDQFFWEKTNWRRDRYGGDIAARTRFAVEIVREMRRQVGSGFPLALRFSQWKLSDHYDARLVSTPQELEVFLRPLADSGVDLFDCSTRRYWEPAFTGSDLNLAGWTRKITGVKTMTVGSVGLDDSFIPDSSGARAVARPACNLQPLLRMLERGECDLVGVGRALLANPTWAERVRNGELTALEKFERHKIATTLY